MHALLALEAKGFLRSTCDRIINRYFERRTDAVHELLLRQAIRCVATIAALYLYDHVMRRHPYLIYPAAVALVVVFVIHALHPQLGAASATA